MKKILSNFRISMVESQCVPIPGVNMVNTDKDIKIFYEVDSPAILPHLPLSIVWRDIKKRHS